MNIGLIIASIVLILAVPDAEAACPVTIAEAIKRVRPEPLRVNRAAELVPVPFDRIVAASDLIIEGVVQPIRTFVSEDGCDLYTDYALTPRDVLAGSLRNPTQPGPSLVVRQWGGETTIDGVKVVFRDTEITPLKSGQNVLLFLTRLKASGAEVYSIYGGFAGAFEVVAGEARSLASGADTVHGAFARRTKSDFAAEIKRLRR